MKETPGDRARYVKTDDVSFELRVDGDYYFESILDMLPAFLPEPKILSVLVKALIGVLVGLPYLIYKVTCGTTIFFGTICCFENALKSLPETGPLGSGDPAPLNSSFYILSNFSSNYSCYRGVVPREPDGLGLLTPYRFWS